MAARVFADPDTTVAFVHFGGFDAPQDPVEQYVVIDVETTGLDPATGERVLEIAALRTTGDGQVTASLATLVNPGLGTTGAPEIHGITLDMLQGAPTFAQVWPALEALMAGAVFVAHNAAFDAAFIAAEAQAAGIQAQMMPGLCTLWLARQALPGLTSYRLSSVRDELGLVHAKAHAAYDDALVVVEALPHLLSRVAPVRHFIPTWPQRPDVPQVPTLSRP